MARANIVILFCVHVFVQEMRIDVINIMKIIFILFVQREKKIRFGKLIKIDIWKLYTVAMYH